jgi:hypothetical protein
MDHLIFSKTQRMKTLIISGVGLFITSIAASGQLRTAPDSTKKLQTVEASCGSCNFSMKGKGCFLAVRVEGKAYLVDGTGLEDHGDAHGEDGFCEVIRKAEVQGDLVADRFKVSYFKLLPYKKPEPVKQ